MVEPLLLHEIWIVFGSGIDDRRALAPVVNLEAANRPVRVRSDKPISTAGVKGRGAAQFKMKRMKFVIFRIERKAEFDSSAFIGDRKRCRD